MTLLRGVVIDVHRFGGAVRLEDGRLGAISAELCETHRDVLRRARADGTPLAFRATERGGRLVLDPGGAAPAQASAAERVPPQLHERVALTDGAFEAKLAAYARSVEETWGPPDRPEPAETHRRRKAARARTFEAPSDSA